MSQIIAKSVDELDQIQTLLDKDIPTYRAAYSDRTAWIMACLSQLAYIKFNPFWPSEKKKQVFLDNVEKLIKKRNEVSRGKVKALLKLVDVVGYDHDEEKNKLINELNTLNIELIDTFDINGTQAILVSYDKFIVLAFRGTEPTSIKDIKADMKAVTMQCETGGKIHTGFNDAFNETAVSIQKKLNEDPLCKKPLFITGHSLGGALATIAAKKLTHEGKIVACYTFGSPRVGDTDWIATIKTPIYRLVNAADCVTMLPPGGMFIYILSQIIEIMPWFGRTCSKTLFSKFGNYMHCGNMRYMTNCKSGFYDDVQLLYSVGFLYRIYGLLMKSKTLGWMTAKKPLAHHSISTYRKKLFIIAKRRNNINSE